MCPVSLGTSRSTHALETGEAKLWLLQIGVDCYKDEKLPELRYSALDCRGVSEALIDATQTFPQKEIWIYHDAGAETPILEKVRASLQEISTRARAQDTVIFYFSGHGILEANSQQPVLCLADTQTDRLLETGLSLRELLKNLSDCEARSQVVWLDACHSGGMTLRGARGKQREEMLLDPTPQLMEGLRQRAAQSRGFYAFLSCDRDQQSWEFPQLEHGVFSYFLMRGLRGEAADSQGIIEADRLYRYVYYQTLQYIDKTNQQLRLINQQKRSRGETQLHPEYPLQTPKRIVEGIGDPILGLKPKPTVERHPRQALVIDGLGNDRTSLEMSRKLRGAGDFALNYFPQSGKDWTGVQEAILTCLQSHRSDRDTSQLSTALLYLRGRIEQTETGESLLVLGEEVRLSRSWLRSALRRSNIAQQVIILDSPGAWNLADWVEDLQMQSERGQCIIAAASPKSEPDTFARALLETMIASDRQMGLSVASWIAQLQVYLSESAIKPQIWLSGTQGAIEILPGRIEQPNLEHTGTERFDLGLCPYMGLRAFSEEDSQFFFGREALSLKILNELTRQPFLALVGASGSGKSSVLYAGVLAKLRQGKYVPESETWWVRSFRPGSRPLEALIRRLIDSGTQKEQEYQQKQLERQFADGKEGFVGWLRSRPEPMVVLAIDQFEEIFTLASSQERQQFLDLILEALEYASDRFKLIITLRTDFIAPCLEIPALAQLLQASSVLVPPYLRQDDYRQIIVKPAEKVGLKVESELVEVLLQELSHASGDLPLLEFVLEQVWENRQPGKLTLQVYQQQIGGLKGALEKKAQAIYESMNAQNQACARWIFLALTQLGEGTEDTRRRVLKSELVVAKYPASLIEQTLQVLTAAKLVVVCLEAEALPVGQSRDSSGYFPKPEELLQTQAQEITVEVAHEILIRHWSTLREWLQENRERIRVQRQIEQAALQWKQNNRQPDFLLRGVQLASAEEIYLKYRDELSTDVRQFIEAGLQAREELQRQTKRQLRRAQRTAIIIALLAIASTIFGVLAYRQKQDTRFKWINSLSSVSEAQLKGNQQLESILASVRAGQLLYNKPLFEFEFVPTADLQIRAISTLEQAIDRTQEINRLDGHTQQVNSVSYSPDGQLIASGSDDKTVRIWKPDGTLLHQLKNHRDRITNITFSSDGKTLVSESADGTVNLWNPTDGKLLKASAGTGNRLTTNNPDTSVALSPDGQILAQVNANGTISLQSKTDGKPPVTIQSPSSEVNNIRFSPNGKTIATASPDGAISLWNTDGTLLTTLKGHTAPVLSLNFSPDGQTLISGSADMSIRLWNIEGIDKNVIPATSASFSPDGKIIAVTGKDGSLQLGERDENNTIKLLAKLNKSNLPKSVVSFSPDGKILATDEDKTIQLWNVGERTLKQTLTGHQGRVTSITFSPDGNILASGDENNIIRLWDAADGSFKQALTGHKGRITSIIFSADGKLLASSSDDGMVMLWQIDNNSGKAIATLPQQDAAINALSFNGDGQILATANADNTIKLWQVKDGSLIKTLARHLDKVTSLSISPDGKILVSGSADKTIRLWNVADGVLIKTLAGHPDVVNSVSFSPDGKALLSASEKGGVQLWDFDLESLLNRGCDRIKNYLKNNPNVRNSDRAICKKPTGLNN
jgi:WD40 repeat protein/uncharacterized caspase-like protein